MRLLESRNRGERRSAGAMASIVAHAAVIAAAIVGTAQADAGARPDPAETIKPVYRPPAAPVHEAPRHGGGNAAGGATTGRTVAPPTTVLDGLPPLGVDVDVALPPTLDPTAGALDRGGGEARPGGGVAAPGAGGIRDALTVEVAAAPDPRNPAPVYPEPLRVAGVTGRVLVEFVVDTTGRVQAGSVRIVESAHPLFDPAVRRTVPALRFAPARVAGRPVRQLVRMPFEFDIAR